MKKLELIIEHGDGELWGRVTYNDNLITGSAKSITELETQLKELLHDFEGLDPEQVTFTHLYDVYALFQEFDFLSISRVAYYAGINPGLMRQYASGVKHPSVDRAKDIERTLHRLAVKMQESRIYA